MLFNKKVRTNTSPVAGISQFEFLDQSALSEHAVIRERLNTWFESYPPDDSKDLRNRFRSGDYNHEGAFFELFLHELLIQLGFVLKIHPDIRGTSTHPDFLVSHRNQHLYLEATVAGKGHGPFTRNRNEEDVINKLNSLKSSRFYIGVIMNGELKKTLSEREVTTPFKELLDAYTPEEVQRMIDEDDIYAAPSKKIEHCNWVLEGWLIPVSPEGTQSQQIVIDPYEARLLDDVSPVRRSLKEKGKKYLNTDSKYLDLDAPLVVAVHHRSVFYGYPDTDMAALFGDEELVYDAESLGSPPQIRHKRNGFWHKSRRIDAVLMFNNIDSSNLQNASGCLYINPQSDDKTLPDSLFRLTHAKVLNDKMNWFEGENIAKLVGWGN